MVRRESAQNPGTSQEEEAGVRNPRRYMLAEMRAVCKTKPENKSVRYETAVANVQNQRREGRRRQVRRRESRQKSCLIWKVR